jgi:septum formation protein
MSERGERRLILASGSKARRNMLAGAGLAFEVRPATVDEPAVRVALEMARPGVGPAEIALALAEAKALDISRGEPGAIVIGSDQVLEVEGAILSKSRDLVEASRTLRQLAGREHRLNAAVAIAETGVVGWRHVEVARVTVRPLDADAIKSYLELTGEGVLGSVGVYELEGLGARILERVDGDFFTVLGMPLLPLLGALRARGVPGE